MECLSGRNTEVFSVFLQQKRPDSPLEPTNPFLEDEPGEDVGTEKDEDLAKVSWPEITSSYLFCNITGLSDVASLGQLP